MAKTDSTGYVLKENSNTSTIDLTNSTHYTSGRVRWKGIDTTVTASNSASTTLPAVPTGYTFDYHQYALTLGIRNNESYSVNARCGVDWGTGSYSWGNYVSIPAGQTRYPIYVGTHGTNRVGETPAINGDAGGADVTVVYSSSSCFTYGTKDQKTSNPSVTLGGTTVSHSGEVNAAAETSWYNFTFSLTAGQENVLTHTFASSSRGYVELEYTYEPMLPAPSRSEPENGLRTTDTTDYYVFTLTEDTDNSATKYHARIRFDEFSTFPDATVYQSSVSQTNWAYYDTGTTSWTAFPSAGVDPGTQVRFAYTGTPGTYYWDVAAYDDYGYGTDSSAWSFRILATVSGLYALTIDSVEYSAFELSIAEASNGEIGFIRAVLDNQDGTTYEAIDFGDTVTVAFNDSLGNSDEFTGRVRSREPQGQDVAIYAITGDGILAERIVKTDYTSADIGASVASMITSYCSPLTTTNVDTTTGFTAPVPADGKTALAVLEELRKQYGIYYHVDSDWDVHFYLASAIDSTPTNPIKIVYGDPI